jgi:hypothetical protein
MGSAGNGRWRGGGRQRESRAPAAYRTAGWKLTRGCGSGYEAERPVRARAT